MEEMMRAMPTRQESEKSMGLAPLAQLLYLIAMER